MVCYAVPLVAAIAHSISRKKITNWKNNVHHLWLGLLLAGGAIFGVVDHLWNGELFLIGENIVSDLLLGVVITTVMFVSWAIIVLYDKARKSTAMKSTQ